MVSKRQMVKRASWNVEKYGPPVKWALKKATYKAMDWAKNYGGHGKKLVVNKKRPRTNINAMADRASMKTKGRKKVKSIVHRKKSVKVSKTLRKKVQKVIDGNSYKGTYTTSRFGTIGVTNSNETTVSTIIEIRQDMGGYPQSFGFQKQQKNSSGHNRWWFAQPLQSVGNTTSSSLVKGSEWQFFTPLKIVDAASVLWNRKPIDVDYSIQTANFNTVVVAATGLPVTVGTAQDPQIKGLKVLVDNSYVKFTMKNNSQRTLKISVYNCVSKVKFPEQLPLDTLQDGIVQETDGLNTAYFSALTPDFNAITQQAQALLVNPSFEPSMCKAFSSTWKYEKKVIRIDPGESVTHSIQGPKGYLLDYRKLFDGGFNEQGKAYKQTSCCVMMSVEADLVYATLNAGTAAGVTGHWVPGIFAVNTLVEPLSIQYDEVYRLSIPDITGFSKNAIGDTAGKAQVLNLRIPRRAFGNFTDTGSSTQDPVHVEYDEQNPALSIVNA